MNSTYDNMHKNEMFCILICINNHVIISKNCMLSSCQLIGCQGTSHTLGDIEYIKTLVCNLAVIDYHICIILHPHETSE